MPYRLGSAGLRANIRAAFEGTWLESRTGCGVRAITLFGFTPLASPFYFIARRYPEAPGTTRRRLRGRIDILHCTYRL